MMQFRDIPGRLSGLARQGYYAVAYMLLVFAFLTPVQTTFAQIQVEAPHVSGEITIIYEKPDCRPPNVELEGECIEPPRIGIFPSELPGGTKGERYSPEWLFAERGTAPYTYAVTVGRLPPGMDLSRTGLLAGTPSQDGDFTFTVTATDANGFTGANAYSLPVSPPDCQEPLVLKDGVCVEPPEIALSPSELPGGNIDTQYQSTQVNALGGRGPYEFTVADGDLPLGLTLTPDGSLVGVPARSGASDFIIMATDRDGFTGLRAYSIAISDAPPKPDVEIVIRPGALPGGTEDVTYPRRRLRAQGGEAPYIYVVTDGGLPTGLSISPNGVLSGKPTRLGTYSFTLSAMDANQEIGSQSYRITIARAEEQDACGEGQVRFGANCVDEEAPTTNTDDNDTSTRNLNVELQTELKRIGCLTGAVDGIWGPGSRGALAKFVTRAGVNLDRQQPTDAALRLARTKPRGFCPAYKAPTTTTKSPTTTTPKTTNCPGNSYWNGANCVCQQGLTWNGSTCARVQIQVTCPANAYPLNNGTRECACNPGYVPSNGQCVYRQQQQQPQQCGEGQYWCEDHCCEG